MTKWITILFVLFATLAAPADEPWHELARAKYEDGDYNAARDLCEAVLQRDSSNAEATSLLGKSKTQLEALARHHYVHGLMLESLNRIEEAKQYWNHALNYLRPGDRYHDWTQERLAHYH